MKLKLNLGSKQQKEVKTKKPKQQEQWKWYRVTSSPFQILSEEDQDRLTGEFTQLLNMINEGAVYIYNKFDMFDYEDMQIPVTYTNFFLGVKGNQEVPFFNPREDNIPVRPSVKEEYQDHVVLEDGSLTKVYVAYNFPNQLPDGFLYEYYGTIDELYFYWKQVPQSKAIRMITNARLRAENMAAAKPTAELQQRLQKLRDLSVTIGGSSRLLEFYLFLVVKGKDDKELSEKEQMIKNIAAARLIDIEAPKYIQKELYEFRTQLSHFIPFSLTKNYIDTISASTFYPFINEDLIEEGGLFLGISGSGAPVVFDIFARNNYNIVILGEPGSGKSMTVKVFLKRLRKIKQLGLNVLDPENEYVKVADVLGADAITVQSKQKLGLDPFAMIQEGLVDATDIAELLADLYYVPNELRPKLRRLMNSTSATTIFEFIDELRENKIEDLLKYLEAIESPPDSYVYDGTPIDLRGDIIVGLRELRNPRLKATVSALIAISIQKKMLEGKQILAVDEAWIFSEYPTIFNLLGEIARRGRKYGDVFIFSTQRPWDVYGTPEGRTILEQASTALLLRQRATATETLQKAYYLSKNEIDYLLTANPGQGILRAGNYKLTIQIMPTQEDLKVFSTRPSI